MKEISKERLVEKINVFEDRGWNSLNKSDGFNMRIVAYSPENEFWNSDRIAEYFNALGFLSKEAFDAKRYLNLIKIHYKKYSEDWVDVF